MHKTCDLFIHGLLLPTEFCGSFLIMHQICSPATDSFQSGERTPFDGRGCLIDAALSTNWIDGDGWCTQHFQQNGGLQMFAGGEA